MADELNMTDEEIDKFFEQAGAFHKGERKEYPWPLNEPLYVDPVKWEPDEPDGGKVQKLLTKKYRQQIGEIFRIRWTLLFLMYDIDPTATAGTSAWRELAGKLVLRHVPGLQTTGMQHANNAPPELRRTRGRPRSDAPVARLLVLMKAAKDRAKAQNKRFSAKAEIRNLLKKKDHKEFRERWLASGRKMTAGALEQEYLRARKLRNDAERVSCFLALLLNSERD
jgi:hypothetical protein